MSSMAVHDKTNQQQSVYYMFIVPGHKYATLEMKVIIAGILRKFRLEPVTKPSEIEFIVDIVLRTKKPIYIKFCLRT